MPVKRPHATSYVFALVIFVISVIVCEIVTYELRNVLDLNFWPWKWSSRARRYRMKTDRRTYLVNLEMCTKISAYRSRCLFAEYNRTFCDIRPHERPDVRTARYDSIVQRRWNCVKTIIFLTESLGPLGLPLISVPLRQLLPALVAVARPQLNRGNIGYRDRFYLLLVIANLTTNANLRLAYAYQSPTCSLLV